MKKLLLPALIPFLLGGCSLFLPSGDPPPGNILNNTGQNNEVKLRKPSEAVDYLISSLTMALLERCPGAKVQLGADRESADMAFRVLHESGKITGNTVTFAETDWVLKSLLSGGKLQLSLEYQGGTVWKDEVRLLLP